MTARDREVLRVAEREPRPERGRAARRPILVTGGAGFVGCNLAHRLLATGERVLILDNLSRAGVERNLRWLRQVHGDAVQVETADIRDADAVRRTVARCSQVYHFAAQVAVTTSLEHPTEDFAINAGGTLNVLEAIRAQPEPPPLVFASTNKVYGGLEDVPLVRSGLCYEPRDEGVRARGIGEAHPLDFHSPYGCSKGTADQYVIDYARSFGLRTVVFRMSCIYGPHQFGTEDQGWVAHFLIQAIRGRPIMLYGDGMQVRDILFVEDLMDALVLAQRHMPSVAGQAFNIGGGPANAFSLLEVLGLIARLHGDAPEIAFHDWRVGDQRYYASDAAKFGTATGWAPRVGVEEGVGRLYRWLLEEAAAQPTLRAEERTQPVVASERGAPTLVADAGAQ